jgi:MSHA biogenesis protein MshP
VKDHSGQGGFALVAALFLLVAFAMLGAFAVRMNMTQRHASDLQLEELRAQAALNSYVEYAAARLLGPGGNCASLANLNNFVGGFAVRFDSCLVTSPTFNLVPVNIYTLDLTASRGAYGTPEYIQRRAVGVRITS